MAFQAVHLGRFRPAGIGIEHFTGRDGAGFNASVTFVHRASGQEIGGDFPKAGFGIFGSKEALNILVKCS